MLSLTESEVGGAPMHTGLLDGRAVIAIVTGMGTPLATRETTRLLAALCEASGIPWVNAASRFR